MLADEETLPVQVVGGGAGVAGQPSVRHGAGQRPHDRDHARDPPPGHADRHVPGQQTQTCPGRPIATRRSADPWQVAERLRAWGLPGLTGRMAVAVGMRPEAPPPVGDADAPPF